MAPGHRVRAAGSGRRAGHAGAYRPGGKPPPHGRSPPPGLGQGRAGGGRRPGPAGAAPGSLSCYAHYLDGNGRDPATRTYEAPAAGVWELVVESRRTSPVFATAFRLTATITG
ncbi:hypothetical protein [Streptomyces sp. t39]|uniref:hypothetical protein n=1 Tax=Streptomyces sp. t39 TaxID=1828156 RepID=UPI00164F203B|nr:hypothetical protein [Streptomyces sp. t39]